MKSAIEYREIDGGLRFYALLGFIGLFVGAVVLAVGYKLFMLWLNEGREVASDVAADT